MKLDTKEKYSITSKIFHWSRVLLLLTILILANFAFRYHMFVGLIFLSVILINIAYRLFNNYPDTSATNTLEKNLQFLVMFLMYVFMVIVPVLGYLGVGRIIDLGFISIIPIYENQIVAKFIMEEARVSIADFTATIRFIHKICVFILVWILIPTHVLAVLYNVFIRTNSELKKMI